MIKIKMIGFSHSQFSILTQSDLLSHTPTSCGWANAGVVYFEFGSPGYHLPHVCVIYLTSPGTTPDISDRHLLVSHPKDSGNLK